AALADAKALGVRRFSLAAVPEVAFAGSHPNTIAKVARALGLAPSRVTLLRGATSRAKVLRVEL
ncbi:MAG: DUF167 domain-containing protein, partial [Sphingomonadales bacterium]